MKILIITASKHIGNTEKLAKAMAEVAPATVVDVEHARDYTFRDFDIIGFGSGVYFGKPDERMVKLLEGICDKKAYAFVFSTSGGEDAFKKGNEILADLLKKKNKIVLGSFGCKGLDKFFVFKLFGGMNKGCPTEQDLKNAQEFILGVMKKYEEAEK